jgi:tetratricopeptide (TPR) repeat protein
MEEFKKKGNESFTNKKYQEAISLYKEGLKIEENYILLTNISSCYFCLELYEDSLTYSNKSIELNSKWWKPYFRKSLAEFKLEKLNDSLSSIEETIKVFLENEKDTKLLDQLPEMKKNIEREILHFQRLERALKSLKGFYHLFKLGLSIGDSFGECFFTYSGEGHIGSKAPKELEKRIIPSYCKPPRKYTDDTEMSLGIVESLTKFHSIDQDHLAKTFAKNFFLYGSKFQRSYGGGTLQN